MSTTANIQFILKTRVGDERLTTKFTKESALITAIRAAIAVDGATRFRVSKRILVEKAEKVAPATPAVAKKVRTPRVAKNGVNPAHAKATRASKVTVLAAA